MTNKIALVTGASSGFGLLTSIELGKAGFGVVAAMRDLGHRERLDHLAKAAGLSGQIDIRALDITKFEAMPGFCERCSAELRAHRRARE